MDKEINAVLETQEQVVWQDVINRKVMIFNLIISLVILMIVWRIASGFKMGNLFLGIVLFIIVMNFVSNYVKKYIITNKRVLIRSGIIGTDFKSIYFTEVKSADVSVGLVGKIFSVGTISIDTGKIETVATGEGNNRSTRTQTSYDRIINISKPYEVYKYFQTSLTSRQESLYSGRADTENNIVK